MSGLFMLVVSAQNTVHHLVYHQCTGVLAHALVPWACHIPMSTSCFIASGLIFVFGFMRVSMLL